MLAGAAMAALSLWSYDMRGDANLVGPVGQAMAGFFVTAFGVAAAILPFELLLIAVTLFRLRPPINPATHATAMVVTIFLGCALVHLGMADILVFGGHLPGGVLGEVLAEVLRSMVGVAGAYVVCVAALLVTLILRTSVSIVGFTGSVVTAAADSTANGGRNLRSGAVALWDAWREAKAIERAEREQAERDAEPRIVSDEEETDEANEQDEADEQDEQDDGASRAEAEDEEAELPDAADTVPEMVALDPELGAGEASSPTPKRARKKKEPQGPVIVAPKADTKVHKAPVAPTVAPSSGGGQPFVLPPPHLLEQSKNSSITIDEKTLRENAERLVEKLAAYGVKGRVDEIHPGPVVTMYEFEPESGVKISKIAGLSDDLAMALAAQKVRIVAPIPGKARVGFEIPNRDRQMVGLRDMLEDERWRAQNGALPVALGKDIAGQPVYGDLAKMPHVLVAGATGAGKSVGLNVMLSSLLMKKTPEDVRLLMIDPKVVELAVFDGIPHMLLPVVTDMKKASLALRWAVDEMERRYQLFADAGARNIGTYNARVLKVHSGELPMSTFAPNRKGKVRALGYNGEEVLLNPDEDESPDAEDVLPEKLPSIVLVVDEFADLMMVAAKDVEAAIARLAQKARAAGIHVILATQRPSVDVITGMIKANFPSRIAYKVSQREDSKTILGRNGAENLLGLGDMLTLMPGSNDLQRVHSAFISEDEVKAVCDFLRAQGEPVYDSEILKPREEEEGGVGGAPSDDPTYDKAVQTVADAGYCSISGIQRNLGIGYNKAAKLVERMEKDGIVGPPSGKAGGRREVFIQPQ